MAKWTEAALIELRTAIDETKGRINALEAELSELKPLLRHYERRLREAQAGEPAGDAPTPGSDESVQTSAQ